MRSRLLGQLVRPGTLTILIVLLAYPALAGETLTDAQIRDSIIQKSISAYLVAGHPCACPYNLARNGSNCGGRSAYSRRGGPYSWPGGAAPLCYPRDVSDGMVTYWRRALQ